MFLILHLSMQILAFIFTTTDILCYFHRYFDFLGFEAASISFEILLQFCLTDIEFFIVSLSLWKKNMHVYITYITHFLEVQIFTAYYSIHIFHEMNILYIAMLYWSGIICPWKHMPRIPGAKWERSQPHMENFGLCACMRVIYKF